MPITSLADLRTGALVELIGSDEISPGAGAAGAVTLALGAACGAKAVAVSLKHSPENARLHTALIRLETLRDCALLGADVDTREFADVVRLRTERGAQALAQTGEAMTHLIEELLLIVEEVEHHVRPNMAGDLIAAKALATAARAIQSANEAEAIVEQRALAKPFPSPEARDDLPE